LASKRLKLQLLGKQKTARKPTLHFPDSARVQLAVKAEDEGLIHGQRMVGEGHQKLLGQLVTIQGHRRGRADHQKTMGYLIINSRKKKNTHTHVPH
jgi:hypothetical protein